MKKEIHPNINYVIFHDTSCGAEFLVNSSIEFDPKKTKKWSDGKDYPIVNIDVSSASHPFYTGKARANVNEGQVAKFNKRFQNINI